MWSCLPYLHGNYGFSGSSPQPALPLIAIIEKSIMIVITANVYWIQLTYEVLFLRLWQLYMCVFIWYHICLSSLSCLCGKIPWLKQLGGLIMTSSEGGPTHHGKEVIRPEIWSSWPHHIPNQGAASSEHYLCSAPESLGNGANHSGQVFPRPFT